MSNRSKRMRDAQDHDRYIEEMIVKYEAATGDKNWTRSKVAAWAIENQHWERHRSSAVKELARHIARVAGKVTFDGGNGVRVRKYHAYQLGHDQPMLWSPIYSISPENMKNSINSRRDKLVGGAFKAIVDANYFNAHHNPGDPIIVDTDLTHDVHEKQQSTLYDDKPPEDDDDQSAGPVPA